MALVRGGGRCEASGLIEKSRYAGGGQVSWIGVKALDVLKKKPPRLPIWGPRGLPICNLQNEN